MGMFAAEVIIERAPAAQHAIENIDRNPAGREPGNLKRQGSLGTAHQ
jgi:hypothetical protein